MTEWTPSPFVGEYPFDAASVTRAWSRLHAGDREPFPADPRVLAAWAFFHQGDFKKACDNGLKAGAAGATVANAATCVYANYLESNENVRLELFLEAAKRAAELAEADPDNPNAHFWHAYALGRYSHGISVAKALAQGLGRKVKHSLERAIGLQPGHADAHVALGTFHAEVIDKVGALIGSMTYGAKKSTSLALFEQALHIAPKAPLAMIEYANALVMFDGDKGLEAANKLYQTAAAVRAIDAVQRFDVEVAQAELVS